MAEINIGKTLTMLKSNINTSNAKSIPAIGALKAPAIAPAAPHPTSIVVRCLSKRKNLDMLEAMADPVYTIGASNPTEPPNATVIEDVSIEDQVL